MAAEDARDLALFLEAEDEEEEANTEAAAAEQHNDVPPEDRAFVCDFMARYYTPDVAPWEDIGKLGASDDESEDSEEEDVPLSGKRSRSRSSSRSTSPPPSQQRRRDSDDEEEEEEDDEEMGEDEDEDEVGDDEPLWYEEDEFWVAQEDGADESEQRLCRPTVHFDPDFARLKKLATGSDKPTPDQLTKMAEEPKTYIPVVHPDIREESFMIIQWYQEYDYEPGAAPCTLCEMGFAESTMDRGNEVVRQFMTIYLSQRGKSHPRSWCTHLATFWNTELCENYEKIGIRNSARLVPPAIYHHFRYHVRDPAEINYRIAHRTDWLATMTLNNGVFRREYKYGEPTGVLEISPANVRMHATLGASTERHLKSASTYALDSQWLQANQHLGPNALRACSGSSMSRAMNRIGGKVTSKLRSKEMNSTM